MAENARTTPSSVHRFYSHLNTASSALKSHILGAFSRFTSQLQFNNAAFSTLRCYLFYFTRLQFINYFNQSIAFIIPVLTTFLQLKYQGINDPNKTPFATHPKTMRLAVSSSVVYYIAYMALRRFPLRRFAVVAHHCMVSFGYLSVASLVSLLLPVFVSRFVYAVLLLLSASELLNWLYHSLAAEEDGAEFQVHIRGFRRFLNSICRIVGNSSEQRQQILPI